MNKIEIDLSKIEATELKKILKSINSDIITNFKVYKNYTDYGVFGISYEAIGNLPIKLSTIQQVKPIIVDFIKDRLTNVHYN